MSGQRLTIRFSDSEWTALERSAAGRPVSTFARQKLIGDKAEKRQSTRRPQASDVLLAQILAALGSSDLSKNMREIAEGMQNGTLPQSDDIARDIRAACLAVEKIRYDLIRALGVKPE